MTTQITDHVEQAKERLAGRDKTPNTEAFIGILTGQIQDAEDAWWQLYAERGVNDAVGAQLDDIGVIVGQPRDGASDDDYRRFLSARIAANNSEGTLNDFIKVARSIINDASLTVRLEPQYPAALVVYIEGGSITAGTADILIEFLKDTRSGGIKIQAHHHIGAEPDTFETGSVTDLTFGPPPGSFTLEVTSTDGFDDAGDLIIDYLGANQEARSYTSKDATHFYLSLQTSFGHTIGSVVKTADSGIQGFSDTASPSVGGELASVLS